jgi:ribosomal protein S18 acetylase RimI-like enzyme
LLVELQLSEQSHYADHPQLSPGQIDEALDVRPAFEGENVVFACRDADGGIAGFCWVVLFDPGTGLEGELAEVYVAPAHRGQGVGEALVRRAVQLFEQRGVTLGYVWTRPDNQPALRLYRGAGFEPTPQLILTWYPGVRAARDQRSRTRDTGRPGDDPGPASGLGASTRLDQ